MLRPSRILCLLAASVFLAAASTLNVTTSDLGGGLFRYDLTLTNTYDQPLSGLNLIHAGSAFGVDFTSTIMAPANWDFFAPLPPLVDELNFFSLDSTSDLPIGGSLSGFSFDSFTAPSSLPSGAFAFDVIGGTTGTQLPEASTTLMLLSGIAGILVGKCGSRSLARPSP